MKLIVSNLSIPSAGLTQDGLAYKTPGMVPAGLAHRAPPTSHMPRLAGIKRTLGARPAPAEETAGAADAVRVGVWRQAHQRRDAAGLHRLPAAAHGAGNHAEATSRRTAAGAAHALRLALRREAHRHEDAAAVRSLLAPSEGFWGRRVPVEA
jgi:hypothetical protein